MDTVTSPIIDLSSDPEDDINVPNQSPNEDVFTLDWDENDYPQHDFNICDLEKEPIAEKKCNTSISSAETEIYTPSLDEIIICDDSPVKSQKDKLIGKQTEKLLQDQRKIEIKSQREQKKAEELKQKRIKSALAKKHKFLKPEENIKLLTVHIDTKIVNSELGGTVITSLCQSGIQYDVRSQIMPSTISWSKKLKDIVIAAEGIMEEDIGEKEEDQLLYLIDSDEFVKLIDKNELLIHIQTIKSAYLDRSLTVVVVGIQKYFSQHKSKINNKACGNGKKKARKNPGELGEIYITKDDYESSLIELELIGKCNHWPIETGEELASLVVSTTKSLSQIDYKKEKHKREEGELDWFAKADSKQCVKVDKNGNGLMKLWQQQICQFNAVGIEFASAITAHYYSPFHLVQSYKNCRSLAEAELLLQNIQMRREAGILSSSRRIGPEVSKKIFRFYMSDDPEFEL